MKIHIYVNGKLVYTVVGMRSETEKELYERVQGSIVLSLEK